eukprot:Hpha_TRINITY_DN12695_c0_g1::TRINITY_DN12695_c0_g1_i1::g.49603::m.49603
MSTEVTPHTPGSRSAASFSTRSSKRPLPPPGEKRGRKKAEDEHHVRDGAVIGELMAGGRRYRQRTTPHKELEPLRAYPLRHEDTLLMAPSKIEAKIAAMVSFIRFFKESGQWRMQRLRGHVRKMRAAVVRIQACFRAHLGARSFLLEQLLRLWREADAADSRSALQQVREAARVGGIELRRRELNRSKTLLSVTDDERRAALSVLWRQRQEVSLLVLRTKASNQGWLASKPTVQELVAMARKPTFSILPTLLGAAAWRVSEGLSGVLEAVLREEGPLQLLRADNATVAEARGVRVVLERVWRERHVQELRGRVPPRRPEWTPRPPWELLRGEWWSLLWVLYSPTKADITAATFQPSQTASIGVDVESEAGDETDETAAAVAKLLSRHSRPSSYKDLRRAVNSELVKGRGGVAVAAVPVGAPWGLRSFLRRSSGGGGGSPPAQVLRRMSSAPTMRRASASQASRRASAPMEPSPLASTESWRRKVFGTIPSGRILPAEPLSAATAATFSRPSPPVRAVATLPK